MKIVAALTAIMPCLLLACAQGPSDRSATASAPQPTPMHTAESQPTEQSRGFERTLELQGITFLVSCPNESSINEVTIVPTGLEIDNSPITREVDGSVVDAEVADLDGNGSPEIYVYVVSAGSGSYGSLVAYAANNRKSLSEIFLPPIDDDPEISDGYMGHDQFSVLEGALGRRFPVYLEGDPNARPSGGIRQLTYRLEPGEASWVLRLEDRTDIDASLPIEELSP